MLSIQTILIQHIKIYEPTSTKNDELYLEVTPHVACPDVVFEKYHMWGGIFANFKQICGILTDQNTPQIPRGWWDFSVRVRQMWDFVQNCLNKVVI